MKVKLISYSQCSEDFPMSVMPNQEKSRDIENLVAYCARVSNPSNQMNTQTNSKLLSYLKKHAHWSPFEMVSVCLEVETTRDIARQMLRHRSFSFQEFSQRYSNVAEMDEPFELRELRLQDTTNRQNSIQVDNPELHEEWVRMQKQVIDCTYRVYNWALDNGIAKEQARAVLPEGLTKSRMYMNGTLRSWIHYIDLREKNGTQLEHMEIAKACAEVISKIYSV